MKEILKKIKNPENHCLIMTMTTTKAGQIGKTDKIKSIDLPEKHPEESYI